MTGLDLGFVLAGAIVLLLIVCAIIGIGVQVVFRHNGSFFAFSMDKRRSESKKGSDTSSVSDTRSKKNL